ncbi:MAG: multiheme c-type cytochrome [Deltaproteobacteria bacterium]
MLLLLLAANLGFSAGVEPLDIGGPAAEHSASSCGSCHEAELAEWSKSRHRRSVTNRIFVAGYAVESEARCIRCHAPLPEQGAEVARVRHDLTALPTKALAREGVTCATCHVRDGEAHGNDALQSDALCGSCHEFTFHEKQRGRLVLTDLPIQSTFSEWRSYAAAGGEGSCISCHMKNGHDIRGAHDVSTLRAALRITQHHDALVFESVGVGHDFPTGDVFRHVTVELSDGREWREVARFGRRYAPAPNGDGGYSMVLEANTALRVGEPRVVPFAATDQAYRVRYRYNREGTERVDIAVARLRPVG